MNRFRPSVLRNEFSHAARDDEDSPSGADGNKPPGEYGQGHGQEATLAEPAGEFCIGDHPRGSAKAFLLPLHYETNYDYPLLVWLHSDGYNEHQVEHVMPHISLRNYVGLGVRGVRAADAAGHRFDWPSGLTATDAAHEAVAQAVRQARERFSINSRRVVVAGYGSGGTMGLRIAMRDPHSFAGVVSLGGYLPDRGRPFSDLQTLRRRRLPMLWGWGQANRRYDSERGSPATFAPR